MNFARIDDKCKYIESYNYILTNEQSSKLSIILRNLLQCLSSHEISDVDNKYHTLANLCFRLLSGDYSTARVIIANYENILITDDKDLDFINFYRSVLSCVTEKSVSKIPISSIDIRKGNFDNLRNAEEQVEPLPVFNKKHVLVMNHSKESNKNLNLKLNVENID